MAVWFNKIFPGHFLKKKKKRRNIFLWIIDFKIYHFIHLILQYNWHPYLLPIPMTLYQVLSLVIALTWALCLIGLSSLMMGAREFFLVAMVRVRRWTMSEISSSVFPFFSSSSLLTAETFSSSSCVWRYPVTPFLFSTASCWMKIFTYINIDCTVQVIKQSILISSDSKENL